jgi:hypothetical protein
MVDVLDELDVVVTRIGNFGYNECEVCVEGAVTVIQVNGKVYADVKVAQANRGWAYGYSQGSRFTHDGAGGSSFAIFLDSRHQYASHREAAISAKYDLLRCWEREKRKAPPAAAKEYQKAIDQISQMFAVEPEPEPLPPLPTSTKQPLQYQLSL